MALQNRRVSGTYLDMLSSLIIWECLIAGIVYAVFFDITHRPLAVMLCALFAALVIWLSMILYIQVKYITPRRLEVKYGKILYRKKVIEIEEIKLITPIYVTASWAWSFRLIEISLNSGKQIVVLDRPQNPFKSVKPSKGIHVLFYLLPELKPKLGYEKQLPKK